MPKGRLPSEAGEAGAPAAPKPRAGERATPKPGFPKPDGLSTNAPGLEGEGDISPNRVWPLPQR